MNALMRPLLALLLGMAASMFSAPALAHGLLMKLDSQGQTISGEVYFSNGQRAGGVWVELFDDASPDAAIQTFQTAPDGSFSVDGEPGHAYRVRASGEEGHEIVMTIALAGETAQGTMVEDGPPDQAESGEGVPAWAVLGGFLLLSLIPLYWLRRRDAAGG